MLREGVEAVGEVILGNDPPELVGGATDVDHLFAPARRSKRKLEGGDALGCALAGWGKEHFSKKGLCHHRSRVYGVDLGWQAEVLEFLGFTVIGFVEWCE